MGLSVSIPGNAIKLRELTQFCPCDKLTEKNKDMKKKKAPKFYNDKLYEKQAGASIRVESDNLI